MRILLVEDEAKVARFIKQGLEESGYEVQLAYDGDLGKRMFDRGEFDLVLLDVIIPLINGHQLCRHIKDKKPSQPVIMLTALGTTEDKLDGFESGADDYLVKPFEFRELLARIRAVLKRNTDSGSGRKILRVADLELDSEKKVARRGGQTIELTAREYAMLEYFMKNKGRLLSRVDIAEHVWDIKFDTGTNTVDVYINLLRKKIDKPFEVKLIHTRIGLGYIMEEK